MIDSVLTSEKAQADIANAMNRLALSALGGEATDLRADYSAAKSSRFRRARRGLPTMGSGADYHYRSESEFLKILEYARDMDRNDCIVGQAVDRATDTVVQDGFTPDPMTGDEKLNKELQARWWDWAESPEACDVASESDFAAIERMVFRSCMVDGDVLPILRQDGRLQIMEAHRLRTPTNTSKNVVHGVQLNNLREPLAYYFTREEISPWQQFNRVGDASVLPINGPDGYRRVLHVKNRKRTSQTRGVTAFAPIFDLLGMFEDINFAKLVQQQMVSCFALIRMKAPASKLLPGEVAQVQGPTNQTRNELGMTPALWYDAAEGEELKPFSPNVPNAEFFQHVRLILTLIGINLGLPLCVLNMDASETNFSGFRGAINTAKMSWRQHQRNLISQFHRYVWEWKVRSWIREDDAIARAARKSRIRILSHQWKRPSWPYIEPMKEAQAEAFQVENLLNSPRRIQADKGREWLEVAQELVEDNAAVLRMAKMAAIALNKEMAVLAEKEGVVDQPVTYMDLIRLPKVAAPVMADPQDPADGNANQQQQGGQN